MSIKSEIMQNKLHLRFFLTEGAPRRLKVQKLIYDGKLKRGKEKYFDFCFKGVKIERERENTSGQLVP